jgi:hypothetical protein
MPFAEWVELPTKEELAKLSPKERRKVQQRAYQKRSKFKHPEYDKRSLENRNKRYATDPVYRAHRRALSKEWNEKHRRSNCEKQLRLQREQPLRFRDYHLRHKHGITQQEWVALFKSQGEVCAICGTDNPKGRRGWATDHDHAAFIIRGILCNNCNTGLGLLGDTTASLTKALEYLKRSDTCGLRTTPRRFSRRLKGAG